MAKIARRAWAAVPRASGSAGPSRIPGPDDAIPSVENDRQSSEETSSKSARCPTPSSTTCSMTPTSSARSPTPSISVSTLPNGDSASRSRGLSSGTAPSPPPRGQDDAGSISNHLQGLRLESAPFPPASQELHALNLDSLRAALPSAACTRSRSQTPLLRPDDGSILQAQVAGSPGGGRSRRRHRSSSAVHQQQPYDVRDEAPPHDRFHEPGFQQVFAQARSLMSRMAEVLGSSELHQEPDSTIRTLRDKAQELAEFCCPPTRTVGLVGDSGVGKSSLLNSLLDARGLARTSNGGAACTCVVTEYRYHDRPNFVIDVVLFDEDELSEQLEEMITAWRHDQNNSASMASEEERKHWADRAKLARDTFRAMFAGRSTSALLRSRDKSDERVLQTLLDWARELGPTEIDRHVVTDSLQDCSDVLMRLTSEHDTDQNPSRGPARWPYIKKISVSLNAHILSKGLVLVDLPGLRDLNTARRNITERYLLKCDEIFVICYVGRATTDEGVKSVFELARQAKLSNVGIICNKTDDIRADEAQRDWDGSKAEEIHTRRDALAAAKQAFDITKTDLDDLMDLEEDEITPEEEIEKACLFKKLQRQRGDIEHWEFELQQYMITTRNDLVETKLQNLYRNKIQGGNLHVFCSSNTLYWDKRDLPSREKAIPYLELSGIVAIRRHCMALVSESQLRIATKYVQDDIPNLLSNVELWVETGAGTADAEKKQAVREALDSLEDSLLTNLMDDDSLLSSMAEMLSDIFLEEVYQRRRIRQWTQGAVRAGRVWSGWHHTTYAAFCRQYGDHYTDAVKYHCWNEEAMATMVDDLSGPWDNVRASLDGPLRNARVFVSQTIDRAIRSCLDNALEDFPDSARPLRMALTSGKRILDRALEDLCERFAADVAALQTDALSGLRTSSFGKSMEASYGRANAECGRGSWERKKAIINGTLGREQVFMDLINKSKREFKKLAEQFEEDALAAVEQHLEDVRDTLDIVRSDNVALESERDPAFRARVADEVNSVKEVMERVQEVVGQ